jgi:TonB family protein
MPQGRPQARLQQRAAARPSQAQLIAESRQPARLVLALVLLLVAFGGVIARDHQFWFGHDDSQDAEFSRPVRAQQPAAQSAPAAAIEARTVPTTTAKKPVAVVKNSSEAAPTKASDQTKTSGSAVVATAGATNRTAAPLDVEVVAGDSHRTVHPGNVATKVELTNPGSSAPKYTAQLAAPTNAAELERVNSLQPALGSGDGSYPLLAQQMKVQGSVVLQAFIGSDGVIENLRVVSGPAILASAAQQAVREWRFKPYMLNGQPVETKATITVNFTIKVADNSAVKAS